MPWTFGDRYIASKPRDLRTSVRTGSFDQNTSACGRAVSASSRFASPVDFVSSVSYTTLTRTPERRSYSFITGSEKGRSAETYAVTSRGALLPVCSPPRHAPVLTNATQQQRTVHVRIVRNSSLLRAVREIIKDRHAVSLRPDADLAGILEGLIVPVERLLTVEAHGEVTPLELDPQRVPLVRGDFHVRSLLLGTAPVDRVIDRDVVFQRVGTGDVVVVRILGAPDQSAGLIFLSGQGFELHLYEPVFHARVVLQADGIGRLSRLLQHVRLARRSVICDNRPLRLSCPGLRCRPAGRRRSGRKVVEVHGRGSRCQTSDDEGEDGKCADYEPHKTSTCTRTKRALDPRCYISLLKGAADRTTGALAPDPSGIVHVKPARNSRC